MIDRQEFVVMCAASLLQQGKTPETAAADAEALALNLEKRNIRMWQKDPETKIVVEEFAAGQSLLLRDLVEWTHRRYSDPKTQFAGVVLAPGMYRLTISAIDKTKNMP